MVKWAVTYLCKKIYSLIKYKGVLDLKILMTLNCSHDLLRKSNLALKLNVIFDRKCECLVSRFYTCFSNIENKCVLQNSKLIAKKVKMVIRQKRVIPLEVYIVILYIN